ncbi:MAG: hypothetical protein K6U08_09590, partial [Firmicutes bacterium]|nr:hypothetical protein [Bacillota bacterium]
MDVSGALLGLALGAPVMVLTALAVLVTMGPPVLFRQARPPGGRPPRGAVRQEAALVQGRRAQGHQDLIVVQGVGRHIDRRRSILAIDDGLYVKFAIQIVGVDRGISARNLDSLFFPDRLQRSGVNAHFRSLVDVGGLVDLGNDPHIAFFSQAEFGGANLGTGLVDDVVQ